MQQDSTARPRRPSLNPPSSWAGRGVWQPYAVATSSGKSKTRLRIKTQTMRELMLASGGRCAMTDCGLPLTSATGGWIGTVAHIVGAEKDAPRGSGPESPTERASFENLILMCATHGREVDAPDTGEANFPIDRLRLVKQVHEAKISEAVTAAIEQELTGAQTATGAIDTTLRTSTTAATAEGLLECLGIQPGRTASEIVVGLADARAQLRRLSQPALDLLSQVLELWLQQSRDDTDGSCDFGDPYRSSPQLPCQHVDNRVMRGSQATVGNALGELKTRDLLHVWVDDDERVAYYVFGILWNLRSSSYSFWPSVAQFLYEGHGVEIQDWVRGLDFSIFDRPAPETRVVPWR